MTLIIWQSILPDGDKKFHSSVIHILNLIFTIVFTQYQSSMKQQHEVHVILQVITHLTKGEEEDDLVYSFAGWKLSAVWGQWQ